MSRILRNRLALSTVVATLIILVISVLLAATITYFAINVSSTRVQEEDLSITKAHVWYDVATAHSEAAFLVVNTGGRDAAVGKITVRGQNIPLTSVFYYSGAFSYSDDLPSIGTLADGAPTPIPNGLGAFEDFHAAANDLTLKSGNSMIIYITQPDSISVNDVGLTVSVTIFTSQAMYYKESNVQGATF